ncbi:MAG: ABC transporter permease [Lachnospiraceae bacterium]|nr:ABC transporter permease [Lachnospiraceae bacterium]
MKKRLLLFLIFWMAVAFVFSFSSGDIAPHVEQPFAEMSSEHPLGTDNLGRDLFSLMAQGGLRMLEVIVIATSISCIAGTLLGLFGGYYEGIFGNLVQFLTDFLLTIPSFVMALIFSAMFGFGPVTAGIVFGIGNMGEYANQASALTLSIKKKDFVAAERVLGVSDFRIILHHILPHMTEPLSAFMANKASNVALQYASLAFIGLGTDVTNPDWGTMLYQYRVYILTYPRLVLIPAAMIFLIAFMFHVFFEQKSQKNNGEVTLFGD